MKNFLNVKRILSHKTCADGTFSAMVCNAAIRPLNPNLEIDFMFHKSDEHVNLVAEPGLMFIDFTPPYPRWDEFKKCGTIIIDHHATTEPYIGDENLVYESGVSGALLCYKHVMLPLAKEWGHITDEQLRKWEEYATLISIYDTWNKSHPDWGRANDVTQGVLNFGSVLCLDLSISGNPPFELMESIGRSVRQKINTKARYVGDGSIFRNCCGVSIAYYNNTEKITSEVGEYLGNTCDFSVGYTITSESGINKILISFRSRSGFDVSVLASKLGGGGHKGAAGANISYGSSIPNLENFFQTIELLVQDYVLTNIFDS